AHSPDPRRGPIAGIVLAAGGGSRFGGPKQLATLRGRPLLEHSLAALAASSVDERFVVLGAEADRIRTEVKLQGAEPVISQRWAEGQASSLTAGIRAAGEAGAVVVILGDQPLVSPEAVERVIAARGPGVLAVRATYSGAPGHPVLLERELFGRALGLTGDEGARVLLGELGESLHEVACDDLGSGVDVDTAERLAELEEGG
ncbi:MAG: nucleotidyltransferase family protein, partial [Solirubrobacterales bacterium]|nr:nucleotidyltransferase family protein [Solirubrobacterales bacterium]